MKKALLISGGNRVSKKLLDKYLDRFIIVADGGMKMLRDYDILPNLIIGDMDSIDDKALNFIEKNNIKREIYPSHKNLTDTEICLERLVDLAYEDIVITGALGSRFDHEIANTFLLIDLYKKNIIAKIVDDNNEIFYLEKGTYYFKKDVKKYISLISLSNQTVFTSEGLEYEVKNFTICRNKPGVGVSNEIKDEIGKIIIEKGKVLLVKSKD